MKLLRPLSEGARHSRVTSRDSHLAWAPLVLRAMLTISKDLCQDCVSEFLILLQLWAEADLCGLDVECNTFLANVYAISTHDCPLRKRNVLII